MCVQTQQQVATEAGGSHIENIYKNISHSDLRQIELEFLLAQSSYTADEKKEA